MAKDKRQPTNRTDGREIGDWKTRYGPWAWAQIFGELFILIVYLITSVYFLLESIIELPNMDSKDGFVYSRLFGVYVSESNFKWIALTLSGFIGGTVVDLKWFYHSAANGTWNRDRFLWRVIVPLNSAMVSLFTGFILVSGVIPFIDKDFFKDIFVLLGIGFVFGYYSDRVTGILKNQLGALGNSK